MEEYSKLPNHSYFSKEEKKMIKEKFIKMPHHEKLKFIDQLFRLIENPDNQEEDKDGNNRFVDVIAAGAGVIVKKIELGVALLMFLVSLT